MVALNSDKAEISKFSRVCSVFLFLLGTVFLLKQKDIYRLYYVASLFLFLFGIFMPGILQPIYVIIRKSALIVVTVSMKISLCIIFCLLVTPIGLVVRLFHPDMLRIKIDKSRVSYWEKKAGRIFTRSDYERQF